MSQQPSQLVEHFFRHESARLISTLTRVFGFANLHAIEEAVQSSLVDALRHWSTKGIPNNPSGWVHRVAKNRMLDVLRRQKTEQRIVAENFSENAADYVQQEMEQLFFDDEINDSLLRMIFACCHPVLDRPSQIALTLRILCGFNHREIARALLIGEEAAKKRTNRARKTMADQKIPLNTPSPNEISSRLDSVHQVLYLMFNEGYCTSTGEEVIRQDLCEEAARLCHLLCCHEQYSNPTTKALLALMLFHASRFESRVDPDGITVLLKDQDRSQWDQRLILEAQTWLAKSAEGEPISTFHIEAGIAMHHCVAPGFEETDWSAILRLYDQLIRNHWTPIYVLNHAVALGQAGELTAAFQQLREIESHPKMKNYFLLDCAFAHLYELEGNEEQCVVHLQLALESADSVHQRKLIERKLSSRADIV